MFDPAQRAAEAIARDVTEAKQLQDELSRQATHDALTGLPNRVLLVRKLSEALERCVTTKRGVAGRARWSIWSEQGLTQDKNPYPNNYFGSATAEATSCGATMATPYMRSDEA